MESTAHPFCDLPSKFQRGFLDRPFIFEQAAEFTPFGQTIRMSYMQPVDYILPQSLSKGLGSPKWGTY